MVEDPLTRFRDFARDLEGAVLVDLNTKKLFPDDRCPLGLKTAVSCPGAWESAKAWGITYDEAQSFIHGYDGPNLPILTDWSLRKKYCALGTLYRKWATKRQGLGGLYEEE